MLTKIDVRRIVWEHFDTLRDYRSNRFSAGDFLTFVGVPVLAGIAAYVLKAPLTESAVGVLINALSILAGLLFNLLVLITDVGNRMPAVTGSADARRFVREVYANVSYSILVAIVALVPLLVYANSEDASRTGRVAASCSYALVAHFSLTLLLVLRRIHLMLGLTLRAQGS